MRILIAVPMVLLAAIVAAQAQTAPGTFTETYTTTVTTTTPNTVTGTVSCALSSTGTVLTCTFSQALQPNATVQITIPSGL